MRLTQERIVAIIDAAINYQNEIMEIRNRIIPELHHLISISNETGKPIPTEEIVNLRLFLINLTEVDLNAVITLANEKAHFNPTRVKHNEYMRSIQRRYKAKKRLKQDPLDLGNDEGRQNNEYEFPPQNNAGAKLSDTDEVPLLARLEVEATQFEAEFEINPTQTTQIAPPDVESEEDLKAKFGPDFRPLPPRVGLRRKEPVEQ